MTSSRSKRPGSSFRRSEGPSPSFPRPCVLVSEAPTISPQSFYAGRSWGNAPAPSLQFAVEDGQDVFGLSPAPTDRLFVQQVRSHGFAAYELDHHFSIEAPRTRLKTDHVGPRNYSISKKSVCNDPIFPNFNSNTLGTSRRPSEKKQTRTYDQLRQQPRYKCRGDTDKYHDGDERVDQESVARRSIQASFR